MYLLHYLCPQCQSTYPVGSLNQRCAKCQSMLMARYDLEKIKLHLHKEDLLARAHNIWRYKELLPVQDEANIVSKGEGMSPVVPLQRLARILQTREIFMKDDSQISGHSSKARVASVSLSMAVENHVEAIIAHSDSIEALALASYACRAGLGAVLLVHKDEIIEEVKNAILNTGASLLLYGGSSAEAHQLAEATASEYGWLHASLYFDPYRLEGKKTVGLELAENFEWKLPEVIICPIRRGGTFTGIYKALRELQAMGWISSAMPRMVAVQHSRFAPMAEAYAARTRSVPIQEWEGKMNFVEDVDFTQQGYYIAMDGVYKSLGCAVAISDEEADAAACLLASNEGITCDEMGRIATAAAMKLAKSGWIEKNDRALIYNPDNIFLGAKRYYPNQEEHIDLKAQNVLPRQLGQPKTDPV